MIHLNWTSKLFPLLWKVGKNVLFKWFRSVHLMVTNNRPTNCHFNEFFKIIDIFCALTFIFYSTVLLFASRRVQWPIISLRWPWQLKNELKFKECRNGVTYLILLQVLKVPTAHIHTFLYMIRECLDCIFYDIYAIQSMTCI